MSTIDIPDGMPENLNLYLQALNSPHCGVVITDNRLNDNPIIYCNKAFEEIHSEEDEYIMKINFSHMQLLKYINIEY